jgi:hypothetical protein
MTGMKRKRHPLGRYYRILQQSIQMVVDREVHALLAVYARKHNYTMREAANRAIAAGLALDLAQEDARKKRKETEELLK